MSFKVFHSIPEVLTYGLLILVLIFNIVGLAITLNVAQQAKSLAIENRTNTEEIEKQQNCIAAFFLQPNRTGLTLTNLGVCGNVVNSIKH